MQAFLHGADEVSTPGGRGEAQVRPRGQAPPPLGMERMRNWGSQAKPCHHFLYSGGAFVRLYPVNLTPTRNHAAKPKRRPRGRYRFALDMW